MPADLQTIVQRMIDAGEPEENIAAVIREHHTPPTDAASPMAVGGIATATMAPAIVSGLNALTKVGGTLATSHAAKYVPGVVAMDAAGRVARGDYKGAATEGATAGAMSQVPRAVRALQQATSPAIQRAVTFGGKTMPVESIAPGVVMRGANVVAKIAGILDIPLAVASLLYDAKQQVDREHAAGAVFDVQREARNARPWE